MRFSYLVLQLSFLLLERALSPGKCIASTLLPKLYLKHHPLVFHHFVCSLFVCIVSLATMNSIRLKPIKHMFICQGAYAELVQQDSHVVCTNLPSSTLSCMLLISCPDRPQVHLASYEGGVAIHEAR